MPSYHAGVPARKPRPVTKAVPKSSTPSAAAAEEAERRPEEAPKPSGITVPTVAPTVKRAPGSVNKPTAVPTEAEHEARVLAAAHPNPEVKA